MGSNELKRRVMKRVYTIWFMRKVAPAMFLYLPFLLIVALRETANEFFVARIVDNMLNAIHGSGFMGFVGFTSSAITNVSMLPMMVIVGSMGLFVYLLRRLTRNFKEARPAKSY